ncbi:MAG: DUF6102 family protein [Bacteroidales bacterium]|nr:DUF6102 family protein [Clostridium sp.]MCM1204954.1 DUF6102 family protein [Bacteroidales bacterium]
MATEILRRLLSDLFLNNAIIDYFMVVIDFNTVFSCETVFENQVGVNIEPITKVIFQYAFWLLLLKFAWKLFDTYMLGADGNEDADAMVYVINLGKAIFVSLAFGLLFNKMLGIGNTVASDILAKAKLKPLDYANAWAAIIFPASSLLNEVLLGVYGCLGIFLSIKFILNAVQLVYLRMGIAFAAAGLLDSDKGVFNPYMKKFFQILFAVVIQVMSFKLSMAALLKVSWLWAFALLAMALKAPAWLSEFIMTSQGGGGKLQQALYSFSILRSFKKA